MDPEKPLPRKDIPDVLYQHVTAADAPDVGPQPRRHPRPAPGCPTDVPFFARQQKIVLENSGVIDPERIEEYMAVGGYAALPRP